MLEIEVKFPADFEALRGRLAGLKAGKAETREESDEYFNAPDRDFARTDEALRVRRVGKSSFVTYKGPKTDPHTKTRAEVEVPLAPGKGPAGDFRKLLLQLGYRPVAVVRKKRRVLRLRRAGFPVELCLDEVEKVGRFAELEIRAPREKLEAAKAALFGLAEELGLSGSERRSYLELLLGR